MAFNSLHSFSLELHILVIRESLEFGSILSRTSDRLLWGLFNLLIREEWVDLASVISTSSLRLVGDFDFLGAHISPVNVAEERMSHDVASALVAVA